MGVSRRRKRNRRESSLAKENFPPETVRPFSWDDLRGSVFLVGNKFLGIPREFGLRHPCCLLKLGEGTLWVSKGTDAGRLKPWTLDHYVIITPDGRNGLSKPTAFETYLRSIPTKAVFWEDRMGALSDRDLKALEEAIFGDEERVK